jgi:hypothetical protein
MPIQPWDALEAWMTLDEIRGYHKGVAISYLAREHRKGGDEDISKGNPPPNRIDGSSSWIIIQNATSVATKVDFTQTSQWGEVASCYECDDKYTKEKLPILYGETK